MPKRILSVVILVALVGCASVIDVPTEKRRIEQQIAATTNSISGCSKRLSTVTKYQGLESRLALDQTKQPTNEQIANTAILTSDDLQTGIEWFAQRQECGRLGAEAYGRIDPELGSVVVTAWADNVNLYREVIADRPTYGHINKRLKALSIKRQAMFRTYYSNLDKRLNQIRAEQQSMVKQRSDDTSKLFASAFGFVSELAAEVLLTSVEALAVQQAALSEAQKRYILVTPAYHPVQITQTSCDYRAGQLFCIQQSF